VAESGEPGEEDDGQYPLDSSSVVGTGAGDSSGGTLVLGEETWDCGTLEKGTEGCIGAGVGVGAGAESLASGLSTGLTGLESSSSSSSPSPRLGSSSSSSSPSPLHRLVPSPFSAPSEFTTDGAGAETPEIFSGADTEDEYTFGCEDEESSPSTEDAGAPV
jgi:hypothetical protein